VFVFLACYLRPAVLFDWGVNATLENYVREWTGHTGIPVIFHTIGLGGRRLAWLTETNLYRIAQEALNNVAKHSHANKVDLLLERREGNIVMIVEDNGLGFTPTDQINSGREMGLATMRERVSLMNGSIEIETAEGKGTTVFLQIPLDARKEDEKATE
jgi:signal transduction histidine kinase